MVTLKKRACDRCYRRKQSCSGDSICRTCKKLGLTCTFSRKSLPIGRPKQKNILTYESTKKKGRGTSYSHTGCSFCKLKKKKCDENWPICTNCKKSGLRCGGQPEQIRFTADRKGIDIHAKEDNDRRNFVRDLDIEFLSEKPLESTNYDKVSTSSINSPFFSELYNESFEELSKNFSILPQSLNHKEMLFLNSLIMSSPNIKSADSSKNAVSQNTETSSIRKGKKKELESQGITLLNRNIEENISYEEKKMRLLSMCVLNDFSIAQVELDLLRYFITDVSSILFVDKTSTKFLCTIIPLSIQERKIRYPIVAIAASHRANSCGILHTEYHRDFAIFRAKSQCVFIGEGIDAYSDIEIILLSILLIAIQEILEGNSLYWTIAIEKAASLIHERGGLKEISMVSPLSIQLFCYLDLISSLSTCSTPFLEVECSLESSIAYYHLDESYVSNLLDSKFGFKFGIGGEIFKILGNISTLASLRSTRFKSKAHEHQFNCLANLIELKLQNWSPPSGSILDKHQITEKDSNISGMISAYSLALQWASFLRLHQIRCGYNRKDSRVEACSSFIIKSLKMIDPNSQLETGLMFPLVMVGSVAYNEEDRSFILSRLQSIQRRLRFNYVNEIIKFLEYVWSKDDDEGDSVNWAKIRYFEFSGLVMF